MSAIPANSHLDSTNPQPVVNFAKAHFHYRQMEMWLCSQEAKQLPAHQVEEETNCRGRELLRLMLEAHFRERGPGDVGPALRLCQQTAAASNPDDASPRDAAAPEVTATETEPAILSEKRIHERTLRTIVGSIVIERLAYGAEGQDSIHPLDDQAELPDCSFSYPLQNRLVRAAVQGPYDEAISNIESTTSVPVSKGSCEQVVQAAAADFEAFYQQQPAPNPDTTGSILMAGVDGKGVPMIKPEKTLRQIRLGKGKKRNKKRMATVATVRTQEPRFRTAEAIVASLFDDEPEVTPVRVRREEHQRVWASLTQSKEAVIGAVVEEMQRCDPQQSKRWVAVCDGERALQNQLVAALAGVTVAVVFVLDFIHVLEKLWKVAYCFYPAESDEAKAWVRQQALRILHGQVDTVIRGMRRRASLHQLSGKRRQTIDEVAGYYVHNREWMRYDEYLRDGLPIASGAVEGACRHVVKDRLERTGMRWSLEGAEALLQMRSVYLSGDFEDYWDYHQQQDQRRVHPRGLWQVVED